MAELDDVYIGRRMLESRKLRRVDLLECLFDIALQRRRSGRGATQPLGVMLVERGLLPSKELKRLINDRIQPPGSNLTESQSFDFELGHLLVAAGAATAAQVNECLRLQRTSKRPGEASQRIGEILVGRGYSTWEQIARALHYHGKTMYLCGACGTRFNVVGAKAGRSYACKKCGKPLAPAGPGGVSVSGTLSDVEDAPPGATDAPTWMVSAEHLPELPPEGQAAVDRAVRLYLRQQNVVRREVLKDAERFQDELSRYGLWTSFLAVVIRFGGLTHQQIQKVRQTDFQAIVRSQDWKKQTIPGYRFLTKIATGGFATVFAAQQIFTGRKVALKVLHPDLHDDGPTVARLKKEAGLLCKMDHPGLVHAYEYSEEGDRKFISMELVEGDALDRVVRESGRLAPARILSITRQIAEALGYLFREGYIHRDVKPENVLIDRRGVAKVCDLGFATEVGTESGHDQMTVGTPNYMSPEQAQGARDLKAGTDIYALGLVLYFMLTGDDPFPAGSSSLLLERFSTGVLAPDLSSVSAPEPIMHVLKRMLHPKRELRYPSYSDLLAALDNASDAISGR